MAQINKPNQYFNTKLYTGNGSTNAQTGVGFQPDFLWNKSRTTADNHLVYDAIRGITKTISPDLDSAEATRDSAFLTSIDSDGFTVGSNGNINANGQSFVMWNWKANGAGSANTAGSISSTVSVNTTSGFSIVSYTGTGSAATIGHGLGVVPKMIILKQVSSTNNWRVYHKDVGATKFLDLNTTAGAVASSALWNDTEPTSAVFSIATHGSVNASGGTYIAYCFAEKVGYSKISSYVGNGNADGTFVYTGFKPAWVMIKANRDEAWYLFDNKRLGYNPDNNYLLPNLSNVEGTTDYIDFTSNGFKNRYNGAGINHSGTANYYMAFAENPIVGTNNIPATAR